MALQMFVFYFKYLSNLRNKCLFCVHFSTKSENIFKIFDSFLVSLGRVVVPSTSKIVVNLPGTYEKLPCKEEHGTDKQTSCYFIIRINEIRVSPVITEILQYLLIKLHRQTFCLFPF